MRIAYLCEQLEDETRNGGSIRRRGLLQSMRAAGHVVEVVRVRTTRGKLGFLWPCSRSELRITANRIDASELVWVEGLPLHQVVRRLAPSHDIYWDLCDSWPHKYASEFKQVRRPRSLAHAAAAATVLNLVRARSVRRVYISERDRKVDSRLSPRATNSLVIPNGTDISIAARRSPCETVMLADWNYAPNRRGFNWLTSTSIAPPEIAHAYGKGVGSLPTVSWVKAVGYVDELMELLDRAKLVLAPTIDGAGVKNKVLEPAAAGVPVITTSEGAAGIRAPDWVYVAKDLTDFMARWSEWSHNPPKVSKEALAGFRARHSWTQAMTTFRDLRAGG